MIAVDTNVVVRFLARDDPAQAQRAKALLETGRVFVLRTVVLETEWVLRTGYGFDRDAIADGIAKLLGLPGVEVEEASEVAQALTWFAQGSTLPTPCISPRAGGPRPSRPSIELCGARRAG